MTQKQTTEPEDTADDCNLSLSAANNLRTNTETFQSTPETDSSKEITVQPVHNRKKIFLFIGIVICAVMSAIIFGLVTAINVQGSLSKLYVGGIEINKKKTTQELETALQNKISAITITIGINNGDSATYSPGDAGISYDTSETIKNALLRKSSGTIWQRLQWWHEDFIQPILAIDQDKLKEFIEDKTVFYTVEPVNATLTIKNGQIVTTPDQSGEGYIAQNALQIITIATQNFKPVNLTAEKQKIPAAVTTADIKNIKNKIDTALNQPISLEINGRIFSPTRAIVADWVSPITTEATIANLEYDSGKIQTYIEQISARYINLPRSEISMVNQDGTSTVLVAGQNGTDIANKLDIAAAIAEDLADSKPIKYTLVVTESSHNKVLAQNYDKWIEVNLTTKMMTAYEKSNPVKTIKVSAGAPATPTSQGMYKIYAKVRIQDMRGLNADGSSYFQPDVEWVSYFYKGQAIHGNYWRPASWFGVNNSSHGCVGMLNVDAKWVYEWAPVGTPIINHL